MVSLCGPRDVVRERLAAFRDAGVGTLMVSPMAFTLARAARPAAGGRRAGRLESRCAVRLLPRRVRRPRPRVPDARARRAAGRARARGHARDLDALARARRGRRHALRAGARVPGVPHPRAAAASPTRRSCSPPRETRAGGRGGRARRGRRTTSSRSRRRWRASSSGVPVATLVPHVYPVGAPGFPPYAFGARLPRTAVGRGSGARCDRPVAPGCAAGRDELNETRRRARAAAAGAAARRAQPSGCAWSATFPQLEYPRAWPAHVHVVGPLMWEPPFAARRAARRRRAAGAGGAVDRAGPRAPAAARRARGPGRTSRCACWRPGTGGRCRRAALGARRTRGWSSGSPTRRRCPSAALVDLPRRARHARAGAGLRLPGGGGAPRRRHGRERGAARLGRASACGCRGGCWPRRRCAWPCGGRWRTGR